jgi:hypothetical protein
VLEGAAYRGRQEEAAVEPREERRRDGWEVEGMPGLFP